MSICRR